LATKVTGATDSFLDNNISHVKAHRPDIFKETALGMHLYSGRNSNGNNQQSAIRKLDPQLASDTQTLKDVISIQPNEQGYMNTDSLVDAMPDAFTRNDDIINHAFAADKIQLGYGMLSSRLKEHTKGIKNPHKWDSPAHKEFERQHYSQIISSLVPKLNTYPSPDPDSDNPTASKWGELLQGASKSEYSNMFSTAHRAGANLDFLADFEGEAGQALKKQAIKANLISALK
jgi:hypothetical protein